MNGDWTLESAATKPQLWTYAVALFSCLSILMEQICPIPNEKRYYTFEIVSKGEVCW